MKEILNYGDTVILNGKRVTCTAKHAQGKWHTYHFNDGSSFNGDAKAMFVSGKLQHDGPSPGVQVDPIKDPNYKVARVVPQIVKTPSWLLDRKKSDGKTSES